MGLLTFFLQRRALGRVLGGTRGAQAARSGGFFTGTLRKAALAGITAMLFKRSMRRR